MDRFVTRTPTWKTLNYTSMATQSAFQKKALLKKIPADKKPLQDKNSNGAPIHSYEFEKRIVDLLPSNQTITENFNANSNDSGLSSASSISPQQTIDNHNAGPCEEQLTTRKNHLGKLLDYIDCPVEKENDSYVTTRTPKSHTKVVETGLRVQQTFDLKQNFNPEGNKTPEKTFLKTSNMIMARIQRDLNSPSAAARVKAIRAIKSPTKSAYNHFDISETEKSFHLPEPPSLQEIMRNITVYVEVRSGEDNRSAGVRKVIQALGARVCLNINRETTHVIFKDGLLSTYKKATQMNIPIVSILWIEACKNQRRICDPKDFPISNLDRYENPELYTKMKRVKSMQPDSECNKRVRAKPGSTPKDSTPTQKTGNLKKTSTFFGSTPTGSTNKKKTDISQFFKKIEKPNPSSTSKADCDTNGTKAITDSPATILLDRIQSESYTPINKLKAKLTIHENNNEGGLDIEAANSSKFRNGAQKVTNAEGDIEAGVKSNIDIEIKATTKSSTQLSKTPRRSRRHSLMAECEIETATISMNTMAISVNTPNKKNRRRSSIHALQDMSLGSETPKKFNTIQAIPEECNALESDTCEKEQEKHSKSVNRRRTLYAAQTMEQTNLANCEIETTNNAKTSNTRSSRRRTLYVRETMETSEVNIANEINSNNKLVTNTTTNRRRTCFNFKTIDQTEMVDAGERNEAEQTNDIEMNTPKVNKPSGLRRTLFDTMSPNITSGSLTPTNFQKGSVTSSTLLENIDCRGQLMATPPADATTGKLLEETDKSATPLVFSSTRQPGNKRRTLFDFSMDIITQRLQCINQSARRSLVPPTPAAEFDGNVEKEINTPINVKKPTQLLGSSIKKSSKETLDKCVDKNDVIVVGINTPESQSLKKKRKLFMPNEMMNTPPAPAPTPATPRSVNTPFKTSEEAATADFPTPISNTTIAVNKRRRTLMPISQPQPTTAVTLKETKTNAAITSTVRKRRSTLDFEQVQNINMKILDAAKGTTNATDKMERKAAGNQLQLPAKKARVLVYTNMHQQQIDVIREAIDKLGLFELESCVTDSTTHLVSLEPRRTLNLLRALARGLWILDYSWIVESLKLGKWLPEESHELRDFSRAIEVSRSERQAFGCNYKCDLFRKIGTFYISSNCFPLSKENMRELITLCGGHVVSNRQKARYIIGDSNRISEDKVYLTPYWVLDSITQMQIMKVNKYLYPLTYGKSASQPNPLERCN